MTEYNYDRQDVYPPDFRDEYRERHFDRSYDESMYYEYMDRSRTRAADRYRLREFHESTREMAENRIMNRLVRYRFLTVMVELFDTTSIQEYFD